MYTEMTVILPDKHGKNSEGSHVEESSYSKIDQGSPSKGIGDLGSHYNYNYNNN